MSVERNSKITDTHLARKAIVYLRQSSPGQVRHSLESQRLQYALADRARALGFAAVEVIDGDLGVSAAIGGGPREGFKQALASVALGEVGIVMSRELSRLSRTDKDFCHLLELCQVTNTLIGDADQIYDLNLMDDQLVLGIKGTLSVVELKVIRNRLLAGQREKARRGELVRLVQPGYVCQDGKLVKDPNLRVQEAMGLIFSQFHKIGTIRQLHRWFYEERIELPVNKPSAGRWQLVWKLPALSFIGTVLRNPLYAGAYVYGANPIETTVVEGRIRKRQGTRRAPKDCAVFIRDHHPGYIEWAEYERNQQQLRGNGGNFNRDETVTAARGGHGLLAGLLRCRRCGRKLHIRYWGKSGTAARYLCSGDFPAGGKYCMGFGGATVDKRLSEQILNAVQPLTLEASLMAIARHNREHDERRGALARQLQQLQYEATRAFEQYDQADPRNRLVAEVLEKRWNEKLQAVGKLQMELDGETHEAQTLTAEQEIAIRALGENFPAVWAHPGCPMVLKKKIARLLIEEILVDLDDATRELTFVIHWRGGAHTSFQMQKPHSGAVAHKTAIEDVDLIRRMAVRYDDDAIARVLSKLRRRTGKGHRWTRSRVTSARKTYAITPPDKTPENELQILTLGQATHYSGASDTTLMKLIRAKILPAGQIAPYAPLEIKRSDLDKDPVAGILSHLKRTGKLVLQGDSLDGQSSLFDQNQSLA